VVKLLGILLPFRLFRGIWTRLGLQEVSIRRFTIACIYRSRRRPAMPKPARSTGFMFTWIIRNRFKPRSPDTNRRPLARSTPFRYRVNATQK
jgi:hypothetical protein